MPAESERAKGRTPLGPCSECGQSLYAGPLGPEHLRFRDDRDHSPSLTK